MREISSEVFLGRKIGTVWVSYVRANAQFNALNDERIGRRAKEEWKKEMKFIKISNVHLRHPRE
jgi:hypothetical protein